MVAVFLKRVVPIVVPISPKICKLGRFFILFSAAVLDVNQDEDSLTVQDILCRFPPVSILPPNAANLQYEASKPFVDFSTILYMRHPFQTRLRAF